jgi:hypothetical protein
VGLVEYRFQPDRFEVRHIRAPGQIDVDLSEIRDKEPKTAPTPAKAPATI